MDQLPSILQRIASTNELMAYAVILLGVLTFLSLLVTVLGVYRATVQHREVMREIRSGSQAQLEAMNRLGYYLFRKLGPVELP